MTQYYSNKYRKVLFALLALFSLWCVTTQVSLASAEMTTVSLVLILVFGILHGSNDILLQRLQNRFNGRKPISGFIGYFALALLVYGLYLANSALMLLVFVAYSAYHFGEESSQGLFPQTSPLKLLWSFFYGSFIFLAIFYGNWQELSDIVIRFGLESLSENLVLSLLVPAAIGQFTLLFGMCCLRKVKVLDLLRIQSELILFFFAFEALDLLASFTLFFVFWHSIPSIISQIKGIRHHQKAYGLKEYLTDAGPIYVISVLSALALLLFSEYRPVFLEYIIVISACITLPHIAVITLFHNRLT
ncbi:MAG: Brp/Blh family beta-carotene 15,15'-dioxygenase [Pricia sp.]